MTRLLLLVVLLAALCRHGSSLEGAESVEVFYARKPVHAPAGTSVKLTCKAAYNVTSCGSVHVEWCFSSQCTKMRDPRRYATAVNETALEGGYNRRREVTTEILHLSREDDGDYQCNAACDYGDTSQGHIIRVTCE